MSEGSKIQWCDDTHNFWRGCVKVSPGCAHCYAEVSTPVRVARSEGRELWGGTLRDRAKDFDAPLRWNEKPWVCDECGESDQVVHPAYGKRDYSVGTCRGNSFHRRRVFSLSLGDWLDDAVPIEWLADMLDVIRRCPNLDFLLLTKRPENWKPRMEAVIDFEIGRKVYEMRNELLACLNGWLSSDPPPQIWIGTTVENQEYADKRIPALLEIPAVCRFISYEPALGPIDFAGFLPWNPQFEATKVSSPILKSQLLRKTKIEGIDWIIVGGESGPKARPFNIEWARSTVEQCKAAGVACFVKQLGAAPMMPEAAWRALQPTPLLSARTRERIPDGFVGLALDDSKGGDIDEWPEDLRVREFPTLSQ